MDDNVFALIVAPLAVGLALFLLAEAVRGWLSTVGARRKRRRQIISLMGRAVAVQARAIDDGRFDQAYIESSNEPISEAREKYDDFTAQALDLFEPGEEVVAMWTAVEFYAGWHDPLHYLRDKDTPREDPGPNGFLLTTNNLAGGWRAARPAELAAWAEVRLPWDNGNKRGPRYADVHSAGDTSRFHVVTPNSDVNVDMLRPFIHYLRTQKSNPFLPPTARETRRLDEEWGPKNDSWNHERKMTTGRDPRFPPRPRA